MWCKKDRTPPGVTIPSTATQLVAEQHPAEDKIKAASANKRNRDAQDSSGSSPDTSPLKAPTLQRGKLSKRLRISQKSAVETKKLANRRKIKGRKEKQAATPKMTRERMDASRHYKNTRDGQQRYLRNLMTGLR